jgi:hypothetical protein
MGVSIFPAASSAGLQPKYQKFTSSGTFTLPTGYGAGKPLLVDIEVIGGGGGGGFTGTANGISTTGFITYFGQNFTGTMNGVAVTGSTGGSGGYAKSQAYLTSNLTITVGAAGSRASTLSGNITWSSNQQSFSPQVTKNYQSVETTGTGGVSTAGNITTGGGVGGSAGDLYIQANSQNAVAFAGQVNVGTAGGGGTPGGTQGGVSPLVGALAGGSNSATPIYGWQGVGGKSTDGATSTGSSGSGGGSGSIGAGGAVILTWWE